VEAITSIKLRNIIECAETLFLEFGFDETTTSMIAKKAMISKRTLYQHFENKEKLYKEVIKRNHNLFIDLSRCDVSDDFKSSIIKIFMLDDYEDEFFEVKREKFLRISLSDAMQSPDLYDDLYNSGVLKPRELLLDWLDNQLKNNKIKEGDTALWANMLMAMILGALIPKRRHFNSWQNSKKEAIRFLDIFIKGM
jgi:AcrR family transcriptional regulator